MFCCSVVSLPTVTVSLQAERWTRATEMSANMNPHGFVKTEEETCFPTTHIPVQETADQTIRCHSHRHRGGAPFWLDWTLLAILNTRTHINSQPCLSALEICTTYIPRSSFDASKHVEANSARGYSSIQTKPIRPYPLLIMLLCV
jgi:hypothetical protein